MNGSRALVVNGAISWVFPVLQDHASPGTAIGGFIKALLPPERGGRKEYEDVSVHELPDGANASCLRPGAAMSMAEAAPAEMVASVTGHVLNHRSALYEYLEVYLTLLIPGALVLAGWKPLPWGQLGRGSVPASLEPLGALGLVLTDLEPWIDTLFSLDSASPPQLRLGGNMRPAVHAAVASLLMYYEERRKKGLMEKAQCQLLTSWSQGPGRRAAADFAQGGGVGGQSMSPHEQLCSVGRLIKTQFVASNAHLLIRAGGGARGLSGRGGCCVGPLGRAQRGAQGHAGASSKDGPAPARPRELHEWPLRGERWGDRGSAGRLGGGRGCGTGRHGCGPGRRGSTPGGGHGGGGDGRKLEQRSS